MVYNNPMTELKKSECDEIVIRQQLVQNKINEINRLSSEKVLMEVGLKSYFYDLLDKYKLDKKKNWEFNGTGFKETKLVEELPTTKMKQ